MRILALSLLSLAACGPHNPGNQPAAAANEDDWPDAGRVDCSLALQDHSLRTLFTYWAELNPQSRVVTAVVHEVASGPSVYNARKVWPLVGEGRADAYRADITVTEGSGQVWIMAVDITSMTLVVIDGSPLGWKGRARPGRCEYTAAQ